MLPSIDDSDRLMDIIGRMNNQNLNVEVFETEAIKGMINFKWKQYARAPHYVSGFIHMIYLVVFVVYVDHVYLNPGRTITASEADIPALERA